MVMVITMSCISLQQVGRCKVFYGIVTEMLPTDGRGQTDVSML